MTPTRGQIQFRDSVVKLQGDGSVAQFRRFAEPRGDHISVLGVDGNPEAPAATSQFLFPDKSTGLGTYEQ